MIERDHYGSDDTEGRPTSEVFAFATALGWEGVVVRDEAHGDGTRFVLASDESRLLEIYPHANVVRLSLPGVQLQLENQAAPSVQAHGLRFDQIAGGVPLTLAIAANGAVTLWLAPSNPTGRTIERAGSAPGEGDVDNQTDRSSSTEFGGAQALESRILQTPSSALPKTIERSKQTRVDLRGQVGRDPTLRRTIRGKLLAHFPLAVHVDGDEQPTWYQILSFGERAVQVHQTVREGQHVMVIGYPRMREMTAKDGSTMLVAEIYAAVVNSDSPTDTQADAASS